MAKDKKKLPAKAKKTKKPRGDRSTPINQRAYEILKTVKEHGYTKTDFASEAIIAHAKERLGDAMPTAPEDVLEARLDYLEYCVSQREWDDMCEDYPNRATDLRQRVAKANLSPFGRDFAKQNKRREAGGKDKVDDTDWITVAFSEKFEFPMPKKASRKKVK